MGNARTTSLHRKLPVELRERIEKDLIEQPPGRSTYEEVWKFYALDTMDISLKAVERYGGYLRALHRNQWIREFGDVLVGEELSPKIEGLIRTRLYESLVAGEVDIDDLRRASMAEKNLRQSKIMTEMWEAKKRELKSEIEKLATASGSKTLDADSVADAIDRVMRGEDLHG